MPRESNLLNEAMPSSLDLRSDTVTMPSLAMREAIATAEVGDDVYGEDPTINRLQDTIADMMGKDAALLTSTATMSNLIAMLLHCRRGDEVITGRPYHVYHDEAGGASIIGGIILDPLPVSEDGGLEVSDIEAAIKDDDIHYPISRLLCLENTHAGKALSPQRLEAMVQAARTRGLKTHLDGARLFNAAVALGVKLERFASLFDTVSICLSKGLGAPAGSVIAGSFDDIKTAIRIRKYLGGGTRQSGLIAAAGLYALEHHIESLERDHERAADFAGVLKTIQSAPVEAHTNMVYLDTTGLDLEAACAFFTKRGVKLSISAPKMRLAFHRDISDTSYAIIIEAFKDWFSQKAP